MTMSQQEHPILDSESIVRIIRQEWLVDGVLQQSAFTLRPKETYLSVNRPAVDTYDADVQSFVSSHASFQFDNGKKYRCASMQVSGVRSIKVFDESNQPLAIDVEVEPRNIHTKSHAGIFTRFQNKNIKKGQLLKAGPTAEEVSGDTILLEVRKELKSLSSVEECKTVE